jgi:hypothetical protein
MRGLRRLSTIVACVIALLVLAANPALAGAGVVVTGESNQNYLSAYFEKISNTSLLCGGRNEHPQNNQTKLLVSYVCQYRDLSGTWRDFSRAPAYSTSSADTGWHYYSVNPCNTFSGTRKVRAQADGYWCVDCFLAVNEYQGTLTTGIADRWVTC